MKKTYTLLAFAVLPCIFYAQQEQRQVSTQANGVIVNEAAGNEGFVQPAVQNTVQEQKIRTIDDWNLAECIEALDEIAVKTSMLSTSAEDEKRRASYIGVTQQIIARRDYLMNPQH